MNNRHLQQLWGASGDFWQYLWDQILDRVGDDEFNVYVYGNCGAMKQITDCATYPLIAFWREMEFLISICPFFFI